MDIYKHKEVVYDTDYSGKIVNEMNSAIWRMSEMRSWNSTRNPQQR